MIGRYLQSVSFFFLSDVLKLCLSFKITPHLSKLIKIFQIYNYKRVKLVMVFCTIFWMLLSVRAHSYKIHTLLCWQCCITHNYSCCDALKCVPQEWTFFLHIVYLFIALNLFCQIYKSIWMTTFGIFTKFFQNLKHSDNLSYL